MLKLWKSDFYRFGKSKLLYGFTAFTCSIAFVLMMLIRQDIRLGISIFGDLTAFRGIDDVIFIGVQYHKGLGLLVAVLISVFIGQEYLWKTWQHKWIISGSRTRIYLSKAILSSAVSVAVFLIFEIAVLFSSGQIQAVLTGEYAAKMICSVFIYAAMGSLICMISMLIKNNTASTIVCLLYVMFSETQVSFFRNISNLMDMPSGVSEWIINHSIYGMSAIVCGASIRNVLPVLINSVVIILLTTMTGLFIFRRYEL